MAHPDSKEHFEPDVKHHLAEEQPGLEVVPEPEAPQVVEEPDAPQVVSGPGFHDPAGSPYQQYGHPANGAYGGYGQYPQSPYSGDPHSQWDPSQGGTLGPSASEKAATQPRICGIPRRRFWLIIGPFIALLVIGIAVGVGVGLGTNHKSSSSAASATPTVSSITCPASNGTIYSTSGDSFLVLCNVDYNSGAGTRDIGSVVTATVEDCATTCAKNATCQGAGWGSYYGTTYCWEKADLKTTQAAVNWFFLVKQ